MTKRKEALEKIKSLDLMLDAILEALKNSKFEKKSLAAKNIPKSSSKEENSYYDIIKPKNEIN